MKQESATLEPGLVAILYTHELAIRDATCPAWTLVSDGLAAFGQREISLTVLRTDTTLETFPEGVIDYLRALKHFASEGKLVRSGDVSGYRAPGPFGLGAFVGVAYYDAPAIAGIERPADALAGVFLTEGEFAMATRCSTRRVLNRLGKEARHFPTPYWSNPLRASVYAVSDVEQSILSQFPRAVLASASATLRGETLHLKLPRDFALSLAERVAAGEAAAVLPSREPGVDAALVWTPGQRDPEAIIADDSDPSAIAATFVGFAPASTPHDELRFMEDGYAALLSATSASALAQALRAASPFELSDAASARSLRVTVG